MLNPEYEANTSCLEVTRLYHETYRSVVDQIEILKKLIANQSKEQYMDPDNYQFIKELNLLNYNLENCINQFKSSQS
jgi:hypothetical protein